VGEEELVDLLQWVEDVRSGPVDEAARRARQVKTRNNRTLDHRGPPN